MAAAAEVEGVAPDRGKPRDGGRARPSLGRGMHGDRRAGRSAAGMRGDARRPNTSGDTLVGLSAVQA
jgi:hypothetical protein